MYNMKEDINRMLNDLPKDRDYEITITRTMGDTLSFYNYEKYKIRLFDDYLLFYETEDKPRKVLYQNIKTIGYRPLFIEKVMDVVDGHFIVKMEENRYGE